MQAGQPVLVVAPTTTAVFRMERIVIGWKDTREARCAVADAMPMLSKASHVDLVEITSEEQQSAAQGRLNEVAGWLGGHGIAAEIYTKTVEGNAA